MLSIDPSSPFTRGAVLGDRIRLSDHFLDPGVFIRSMATRGSLGGLAEAALQAALLMDASGKDDVLLETVGVGQGEIDIVDHADTVVLALMPGSGDSIQALKAGVMEIPDVIVVNKSEHPLTDTMIREVKAVLALGPARPWKVPVVRTEAAKGEGIAELRRDDRRAPRPHRPRRARSTERRARNLRAEVLGIAAARLRRELEARAPSDPEWAGLLERVVSREIDPGDRRARAAREDPSWLRRPRGGRAAAGAIEEARGWIGHRLDEIGGEDGRRASRACWSTRRAASRSGCSCGWAASADTRLVPARDAVEGVGHVWAPYSRELIRTALRRSSRSAPLTAAGERELLEPLRDRRSTRAAPAELGEREDDAVSRPAPPTRSASVPSGGQPAAARVADPRPAVRDGQRLGEPPRLRRQLVRLAVEAADADRDDHGRPVELVAQRGQLLPLRVALHVSHRLSP